MYQYVCEYDKSWVSDIVFEQEIEILWLRIYRNPVKLSRLYHNKYMYL